MTENQRDFRNDFVGKLDDSESLTKKINSVPKEDRTAEHDKLLDGVRETAYVDATTRKGENGTPIVNPDVVKSAKDWRNEQGTDYALEYAQRLPGLYRTDASNLLKEEGALEGVLRDVSDDKFNALLTSKEAAPVIARAAGKDYQAWLEQYATYLTARDLAERAKAGELNDNERKHLVAVGAERAAAQQRTALKNAGYHFDIQRDFADLARKAVALGYVGDSTRALVQEELDAAQKALKEFEAANPGKNLRGYVTAALKKLTSDKDTAVFNTGRDLTYGLAK